MSFGKNHHIVCRFTLSICGLLLHNFNAELNIIAIVLIITQQTCHQCIRSFFPRLRINSILRHGKDSRSEAVVTSGHICLINLGYIPRIIDIRVSSLNFLKICLQNGPCFYAQRFVFDQIIRILVLLNCRFQCSLYCIFGLLRTAAAAAGPAACQCSRRKLAIKKQLCQGRAAKFAIRVKTALRELRCTTGSLQTILLGFLRPQIVDITDFFEDDFLWSPMRHPYRIGKNPTESERNSKKHQLGTASCLEISARIFLYKFC